MGQNIRTLAAHAQWHTVLGLCAPSESDHCVLCHTWMFLLLTPVLPHQLLMAHNSSRLRSTTAATSTERCSGPDMERGRARRGDQFVNSAVMSAECQKFLGFMSLFDFPTSIHPPFFFSVFFYQSYLPDIIHPNHLPAWVWGEIEK